MSSGILWGFSELLLPEVLRIASINKYNRPKLVWSTNQLRWSIPIPDDLGLCFRLLLSHYRGDQDSAMLLVADAWTSSISILRYYAEVCKSNKRDSRIVDLGGCTELSTEALLRSYFSQHSIALAYENGC